MGCRGRSTESGNVPVRYAAMKSRGPFHYTFIYGTASGMVCKGGLSIGMTKNYIKNGFLVVAISQKLDALVVARIAHRFHILVGFDNPANTLLMF